MRALFAPEVLTVNAEARRSLFRAAPGRVPSGLCRPALVAVVLLMGCGARPPTVRRVGGAVSGLVGTGLVLQDNGNSDLAVNTDGPFAFAMAEGTRYSVTVLTQPTVPAQICAVTDGEGVLGSGDVTDVAVSCRLYSPRFAYVTNCGSNTISILAVNATTGELRPVDQVASQGGCPYAIAFDPAGKFAFVANGGAVSAYSIDAATGALTTVVGSPFPAGTSPFGVTVDPKGRFVYLANRLSDDVSAYAIDARGALAAVAGSPFPAGSRPHSVTVDPSGRFAYVGNFESDDISAYRIDDGGALTPGFDIPSGDGPNVVAIHPSGRFAYVSHWGSGDVQAYTVDPESGVFTRTGEAALAGTFARFTTIEPWGRFVYVASYGGNSVSAFTIDGATGALAPMPGSPFQAGSAPLGLTVDPSGTFAYVTNYGSETDPGNDTITIYRIDASSGALELIQTITVGDRPSSIAILRGVDPIP